MDNIIIKGHNLNQDNKSDNLISCCAFRMAGGYKSSTRYIRGLTNLIKYLPTYFPDFKLRIYYDNSIILQDHDSQEINDEIRDQWLPLLDMAKKKPYVQLAHYRYDKFEIKNGLYHDGLFGTIVRFIPLFQDRQGDTLICDIDGFTDRYLFSKLSNIYKIFKKSKSKFHFRSSPCYVATDRIYNQEKDLDEEYKPNTPLRIFAGTILSKITFPKKIFDHFFNCLHDLSQDKCSYIKNFTESKFILDDPKNITKDQDSGRPLVSNIMYYGIDEFFINTTLLKYIENNNIISSVTLDYTSINHIIQKIHLVESRKSTFDSLDQNNLIHFYKSIMGKFYNNDKSPFDNAHILINMTKHANHQSDPNIKTSNKYLFKNFIKTFQQIKHDNSYDKYGVLKRYVDCTLNFKNPHDIIFRYSNDEFNVKYGETQIDNVYKFFKTYVKYKKKYLDVK